jgi:Zn-dependent protease with chaperone function
VIEFDGIYYDGKTSARIPVRIQARDAHLVIRGADFEREAPLATLHLSSPLHSVRRTLTLADGAQLRTNDHAAVAALFPDSHRLESWVERLERRWGYALLAVVVIVAFSAWCVVYGLPAAASLVARTIPASVEATLGEQTLYTLDKTFCKPSALEPRRMQSVQKHFEALSADLNDGYSYQLKFRSCAMGPNAFALPGGTIIVTDALVKLARSDLQLAAVLAHEIGHVRLRHGLRMALQGAGAGILVAALAGDAVALTGLAVTLPTLLLQTGYSRDFETEADTYAFKRMKELGISPKHFADIMMELETHARGKDGKRREPGAKEGSATPLDYLSTHPDTAARIRRALEQK